MNRTYSTRALLTDRVVLKTTDSSIEAIEARNNGARPQ